MYKNTHYTSVCDKKSLVEIGLSTQQGDFNATSFSYLNESVKVIGNPVFFKAYFQSLVLKLLLITHLPAACNTTKCFNPT